MRYLARVARSPRAAVRGLDARVADRFRLGYGAVFIASCAANARW